MPVRHVSARGERHLRILQVERGTRELPGPAGMVEVQVGHDHVAHRGGVDPGGGGHVARLLRVEAGIDDDHPVRVAYHPDEEVQWIRRVRVQVGAQQVVGRPAKVA